ncbi:MAG TPA: MMPL family transporter [Thermomicrobiales bacterium]|nr:MMPL family transporter [Thermomicrobiales bacterium]
MGVRHKWLVAVFWIALVLVSVPFALNAQEPLEVGGFSSDETEASRTIRAVQDRLGYSPSTLIVVYESETLAADDPAFLSQVETSLEGIRELPFVESVVTPELDASLVSESREIAYALIGVDLPPEEAQRDVPAFEATLVPQGDIDFLVAGGPAFYADIETASQRDLRRAEIIALPVALIALLVVFGTVVSALVPLVTGSAGVAVVLMAIYHLATVVDLSIFVLNLATMLGLGLAVDYALFVTSRYREELRKNGGDVAVAIERALETAGRAVFFSGLSVLVGLSGLIIFPMMFLRSVGIAGVVVVAISTLTSLTLLPAVLAIIGTRIESLSIGRLGGVSVGQGGTGRWYGIAHTVMRRPVIVALLTFVLLATLGLPFRHANISSPDATILPQDLPSRQGFDLLSEEFSGGEISPFVILLNFDESVEERERVAVVARLETLLAEDERIERAKGPTTFLEGLGALSPQTRFDLRQQAEQLGTETQLDRFWAEDSAVILAYPVEPANQPENKELLEQLRSIPDTERVQVLVGGGTAGIVDVVDEIYERFPVAAAIVVFTTYVILLVLFRSVVLPIKAIFLNVMSILASYGALVFVFQEGHFHALLNFTPQGFVEASLPVIMFCVLFGLSMDYEVFLLTRVREEWERTGNNREGVALGLDRSGRIITSAALIVVVVTGSFVSADVVLVKALGLGIAIAVAVDATVVRGLLVPATMVLLGNVNWWMPDWLERALPGTAMREG